ncbi:MAG: NAD+ synthase, partial [Acidimicrobiales bacterium]
MSWLRVALCQLGPVVGDLDGNVGRILKALGQVEEAGADLAVFPELAVTGYPPEDLLLKPGFVADNIAALAKVAQATGECAAVVGFVDEKLDLYNSAAVCARGETKGTYHKVNLPNYSVFDEQRYFLAGTGAEALYLVAGVRVGISVCEDAWDPSGPVWAQAAAGAELVVNINASPYYAGRLAERRRMLATRAADASCALVYLNAVGGQDELVFDGASMVFAADGDLVASLPQFEETVGVFDLEVRPTYRKRLLDPRGRHRAPALPGVFLSAASRPSLSSRSASSGPSAGRLPAPMAPALAPEEEIYRALVVGTRDYVGKNGFTDAVVALSGGIDSSLVATIAADALGPASVHAVSMPSRFTAKSSNEDAAELASRLGIDHQVIAIEPAHAAVLSMLAGAFAGTAPGLAEENIQSRLRGVVLMALSNKFGWLVLTTGNKSELAVGYSTLYGDTAGGFAVIKDVPKTLVYRLCHYRNEVAGTDLVPQSVLDKAPSAELRPEQRDDESLPPYDVLYPVLDQLVAHDRSIAEVAG